MSASKQYSSQEENDHLPQGPAIATDRFLAVVQGAADLFWILTPAGDMQEIGTSWQLFTGQQGNSWQGPGWLDAVFPDDQPQIETMLQQAVLSGQPAENRCHIRRSDGVYRLVRVRAFPVCSAPRGVCEIVVCATDITSEQMSEAQRQLALEASGVGTWDYDLLTRHFVATESCKRLYGLTNDAPVTFEQFLTLVHPDDRARIEEVNTCARTENRTYDVQFRLVQPDGSLRWLASRLRHFSDSPGQSSHLIGATIDITQLKQAEERITAILESITEAFIHVDAQWRLTYGNQRAEEFSGKKREEVLGQDFWGAVPGLLDTTIEHQLRKAMATQQVMLFDAWHPRWQRWLEIHAYPALDGLSVYFQDITERKNREEALQESEMRFHTLVESNIIGITVADLEGNIYEANEAFLSLLGYTCEDLAAGRMNWVTMTAPEDQEKSVQAIEELRTTGVVQPFEKSYVTKDGKCVPVLIGATFFHRKSPSPLLLAFVLDLTARKEIERQKDLMLSMTSHELKNPLAALKGTFQLLQRRVKRLDTQTDHLSPEVSAFFQDLLERLAASARQVDVQTHLINDLLDVSRITANTLQLELERCDLAKIVCETVKDLQATAPRRSLLLKLPEHPTVMVYADQARISQVVTNYLTNAIRYSSADQPIHIGLSIQEGVARVWVRDRGPGLTEEAQNELWQSFHQIKGVAVQSASGKGLGLGLYICRTLIAQHQGKVGVESTVGQGSTFWFTLPIVE